MPTPAQAVIFDLDGTLLDTLDDLADSMNMVLNEMDYPMHPTEAYKYFVGTVLKSSHAGFYRKSGGMRTGLKLV